MTLASGGSPIFPLVVHQTASPSIWLAVQSLRRDLSTNPGLTMWCNNTTRERRVRWGSISCSKKRQSARGWNAADICIYCVYTIPAPRDGGPIPFLASRPSLPAAWLTLLTKAGDDESNPGPTTQTNTLQSFGFVTSVTNNINKKQTSIRCNHTHNTH